MSKIRKIIVKRKNLREKGARAVFRELKPHSKVIIFSRSLIIFFLSVSIIIVKARVIIKDNRVVKIRVNIKLWASSINGWVQE